MILRIEDRVYSPGDVDILVSQGIKLLDTSTFNDKRIHPWIASNSWDSVIINVNRNINAGYIKQVLNRVSVVQVIVSEDLIIDQDILKVFVEVYPERASELRMLFMKRRNEDIFRILREEGALFE